MGRMGVVVGVLKNGITNTTNNIYRRLAEVVRILKNGMTNT